MLELERRREEFEAKLHKEQQDTQVSMLKIAASQRRLAIWGIAVAGLLAIVIPIGLELAFDREVRVSEPIQAVIVTSTVAPPVVGTASP